LKEGASWQLRSCSLPRWLAYPGRVFSRGVTYDNAEVQDQSTRHEWSSRVIVPGVSKDKVSSELNSTLHVPKPVFIRSKIQNRAQLAPSAWSASLSSFTAVLTSSKFSAEMAHFACLVASIWDSSSVLNGPWCRDCGAASSICWYCCGCELY
jgi:hypothetical protein